MHALCVGHDAVLCVEGHRLCAVELFAILPCIIIHNIHNYTRKKKKQTASNFSCAVKTRK